MTSDNVSTSVEHNDELSSTSTIESTSFTYEKDNKDLTDYALDFMENEIDYYSTIQSYTKDKVALFICVSGIVSAGAYYESDGIVQEYFRNNDASEKKFNSIQEWHNEFYGEVVTIDKHLNNVFIGEDLVPLWKILIDEMEADCSVESDVNDEESKYNEVTHPLSITKCDYIIIYLFLTLNLLSLLGYIIVSII